jgi:hypothetical protein
MDHRGGEGIELWDEDDGFYDDVLHCLDGRHVKMRVRSMVGLIPLFAVETLESDIVDRLAGFKRRMQWFIDNRPDFRDHVDIVDKPGGGVRRLLSIVTREELPRVLRLMLDEAEFLSPYGVRALSRYHRDHPYTLSIDGMECQVRYEPAESSTETFQDDPYWRDLVLFYKYFHGDNGASIGASHQTGWTALVAKLLQQSGE